MAGNQDAQGYIGTNEMLVVNAVEGTSFKTRAQGDGFIFETRMSLMERPGESC